MTKISDTSPQFLSYHHPYMDGFGYDGSRFRVYEIGPICFFFFFFSFPETIPWLIILILNKAIFGVFRYLVYSCIRYVLNGIDCVLVIYLILFFEVGEEEKKRGREREGERETVDEEDTHNLNIIFLLYVILYDICVSHVEWILIAHQIKP